MESSSISQRHNMIVIAIDGPAAAGKGTLARRIAREYGLAFLDTGALYRGVAWLLLQQGQDPADIAAADRLSANFALEQIEGANIRTTEVGRAASVVAAQDAVRHNLLAFQRNFALSPPQGAKGAVLDGRDIGTVVCPEADLKLFVTASSEARAHRRWLELVQLRPELTEAQVLEDLQTRDARDAERSNAPLVKADDAHLIDTTHLSIDAAFAAVQPLADGVMAVADRA